MENGSGELQCYNRGCGLKYDPANNKEDSCCHHPGEPFFHDAYKGWSCCNKKCTDFTEFLNFKGCTKSKHSNIKPPEPEKPAKTENPSEVIEVKPVVPVKKQRPPFNSPMELMVPEIAPALKHQSLIKSDSAKEVTGEVPIGTSCKHSGCTVTYNGQATTPEHCIYHPGVPIFHEGMKYWSCCTKRTTDFNAFLEQVGCERGEHVWTKEKSKNVQCRWDHHQTSSHVVVAVYAKQYCVKSSKVELNPIRLKVSLVFPEESNNTFELDLELQGIVDVKASQVNMYGTKVEIKLKKAEPGSWSKVGTNMIKEQPKAKDVTKEIVAQVEGVDLDDL